MKKYQVIIIGAGTAGLSARKEVVKKTDSYLVVDHGFLGTTCARVGCMPSKVLIQIANDYNRRHQFSKMGILGAEKLQIHHTQAMNHVRTLRDRFVAGVKKSMSDWIDDHLVRKKAYFLDANTLDLGDEKVCADKIIIATGSKPLIPSEWKKYQNYFIDTDQLFELKNLPKKIAMIGLGVIGAELGQALSRLGVEVIGIGKGRSFAGITDPEILDDVIEKINQEFELYFDGAEIIGEGKKGLVIQSGNQKWEFEKVFLTMGRKPNIDQLGLENIGIKLNDKGLPDFDSSTFRIKNTSIYLAGDVNGEKMILHETADEGRIAGFNSVRTDDQCFKRRTNLGIVFTDPNIAMVGKSFQQLKNENINFEIGKINFEKQGRAIVKGEDHGLIHIYANKETGDLLGAEIFAPQGEHLSHLLAWAISLNLNVFQALSLPFYHPVLEEGIRSALRDLSDKLFKEKPELEVLRCQDPPAGSFL